MWIVQVQEWAKGAAIGNAYVSETYVGPFATETEADAYKPAAGDGFQVALTPWPLQAAPPPGSAVNPVVVAVIEPGR